MAKYDPDWVKSYYDQYGKKEWDRWDASPVEQVKFEVHLHYLRTYLQSTGRILEIGAGPGRFTQHLAAISNRIVVADITRTAPAQSRQRPDNGLCQVGGALG